MEKESNKIVKHKYNCCPVTAIQIVTYEKKNNVMIPLADLTDMWCEDLHD